MPILIVILLWVVTIIALIVIKNHSWTKLQVFSQIPKKLIKIPFYKKIFHMKIFKNPGYIVSKYVTLEKYETKLKEAGFVIKFHEFQTIKQFIVSINKIFLWIYIFFGDWYTENGILFFNIFLLIGIFIFLFFLPDIYLKIQKEKRKKILQDDIPYFVDTLAITLDTGMNLEKALEYVSNNMNGVLAREIWKKLVYINMGLSLEDVLDELYYFIPVNEFQRFVSSIKQAKKLGVSLSKTLRIQSELLQSIKLQKAEEISRKASVKISIPLVVFIFPALLIIYIGPALLQLIR